MIVRTGRVIIDYGPTPGRLSTPQLGGEVAKGPSAAVLAREAQQRYRDRHRVEREPYVVSEETRAKMRAAAARRYGRKAA